MLLPVGVESSRSGHTPVATWTLIALNGIIYIACAVQSAIQNGPSWSDLVVLPSTVLDPWALIPNHALWITFITAPWVHFGLLHIVGNMLFLYVFGKAAEETLGPFAAVGIYVVGGIASTVCQYAAAVSGLAPTDISYAGSSGAVISLIFVFAMRRYRDRVRVWMVVGELSLPAWCILIAFTLWYGFMPLLTVGPAGFGGYWGHFGGAAAGLILSIALGVQPQAAVDYSLDDALAKIDSGSLKAGLNELYALRRVTPDDSRVPASLARTYLKIWDSPAARRCYSDAIRLDTNAGRLDQALYLFREACAAEVAPAPGIGLSLAAEKTKAGDVVEAARLYEWVIGQGEANSSEIARRRLALMRGVGSPDL